MELRKLSHLVALAEERNFSRAAARVRLSQPALSRSIQAIESDFGLQLFERGNREVTCTAAGKFLVDRARRLLFESRCLERDAGLFRERLIGDLAFGTGPYPAVTLVPNLMIAVRQKFPAIQTRVEVNNWKYLLEHLRAEELDFFIADTRNVSETDLSVLPLGHLHAGFYVRSGHPLLACGKPALQPAEILPYGLASVRLPPGIAELLGTIMGLPAGTHMPVALECDDLNLLKQIVLATDTVAGCPVAAVLGEVADGRMVRLSIENLPPLFSDMGIVSLHGRSFSPIAEFAIDALKRNLAGLPTELA